MNSPQDLQISYASVGRRIAAYLTDYAILFSVLIPLQVLMWVAGKGFPYTLFKSGWQVELWVLFSISLPVWLYFAFSEHSSRRATLGKRLFRIQVMRPSGDKIGFERAVIRTAIKLLPWELTHLTLLVPVPIWWDSSPEIRFGLIAVYVLIAIYLITMVVNKRRQSLHDILVDTVVIRQPGVGL